MATQLKAKEAIPESALSKYLEARVQRFIEDNRDALGECKVTIAYFPGTWNRDMEGLYGKFQTITLHFLHILLTHQI